MTINVENVSFHSQLDSGKERDEITLQKKDNISSLNDRFYRYFFPIVGTFLWRGCWWCENRNIFSCMCRNYMQNRNLPHICLSSKIFGFFSTFSFAMFFEIKKRGRDFRVELFPLMKLNYPISTSHIVHFNLLNCCAHKRQQKIRNLYKKLSFHRVYEGCAYWYLNRVVSWKIYFAFMK